VRDGDDAPPRVIPRRERSFARLDAGRVVSDADHVYLAAGFVPGKIYHVIYTTTGPSVIGLGLLTARDTVAFLRHGSAEDGNPCAADIRQAYAFGASQSGRYLRHFLYLGTAGDGIGSTGSRTSGCQSHASFTCGQINASPSNIQGGSRVLECRTSGSVRWCPVMGVPTAMSRRLVFLLICLLLLVSWSRLHLSPTSPIRPCVPQFSPDK
jgi:hypothetical protein